MPKIIMISIFFSCFLMFLSVMGHLIGLPVAKFMNDISSNF